MIRCGFVPRIAPCHRFIHSRINCFAVCYRCLAPRFTLAEPPQLFACRLGKTLRYPVLGMENLRELALLFDVIPFAEAMRCGAVIVQDVPGVLTEFPRLY